MTGLMDALARECDFNLKGFRGYTPSEIEKMEIFYGIKISGDLRRFFVELGRSSGNVLFSDFLIPYSGYYAAKTPAGVSGHVACQLEFKNDLRKYGRPFGTGNPFLFSVANETQYFFLRTKADEPLRGITPEDDYSELNEDPETVYLYDENLGKVSNTGTRLREYLTSIIQKQSSDKDGAGEMIVI